MATFLFDMHSCVSVCRRLRYSIGRQVIKQNMKYLSVRLTAAQVRAMSFMSTKSLSKNMNIYVYIWYSIESVV